MKVRIVILCLILLMPAVVWGQSTLNFPKFFSAAELQVSGFAIVNPNSTTATVTFTLYSATGAVVSTATQTYLPGTQKARAGNEVFSSLGGGGWVRATSPTSGLRGFWLNYDGGLTYLDGAEAASTAVDQVIPLVAGTTEVNIANSNSASQSVTLRAVGESGSDLGSPVSQTIAENGVGL